MEEYIMFTSHGSQSSQINTLIFMNIMNVDMTIRGKNVRNHVIIILFT